MKKRDILKLVKQADRRFFIEAAICPEQHEEEYKMKKQAKIWVIAALAAVLSVGGVTAAVAMRGHSTQNNTTQHDETTPQQTEKPEIDEQKTLGLHLTGDTQSSTFSVRYGLDFHITEGEQGWYYRKYFSDFSKDSLLCFADKETGETVPLCANPECKHDGSLYCTASTNAYKSPNPIWANGALWAVTIKNGSHAVVLQIAPDGSSIKEAADLGEATEVSEALLYRGNLFFYVGRQIGETVTMENEITHNTDTLRTVGYELAAFDLSSQKVTSVHSEMPNAGSNYEYHLPSKFYGIGDYIYEYISEEWWQNPFQKSVNRISLETGELEQVMYGAQMLNAYIDDATPSGILYITNQGAKDRSTYIVHLLNPDTGEDRSFDSLDTKTFNPQTVDENYMYGSHYLAEEQKTVFEIYDRDGKLLKTEAYPDQEHSSTFKVYKDQVYLMTGNTVLVKDEKGNVKSVTFDQSGTRLLSCPVQDILDGKTEWKEVAVLKEPKNEDSSG